MIIIVGGEPELCWVSERVGSVHAHIHYACASLRCARVVRYIESVKTVCMEWAARHTWKRMATPTRKRKPPVRPLSPRLSFVFAGLSFQPRTLLCGFLPCFSPSHRRQLLSMFTAHISVAALARVAYQYHVTGTDTVGQSVGWLPGRSVDACAPVDHDSVGLAQAHPKNKRCPVRQN